MSDIIEPSAAGKPKELAFAEALIQSRVAKRGSQKSGRAPSSGETSSARRKSGGAFGKLWTVAKMQDIRLRTEHFTPDDPDYNPDDRAIRKIRCRG